ncbi:MAG: hypothetical protein Q9168_007636 [Polycauliona sp. 1 TL-2023]
MGSNQHAPYLPSPPPTPQEWPPGNKENLLKADLLTQSIWLLAQELQDMILAEYFHQAVVCGKVFLGQRPDHSSGSPQIGCQPFRHPDMSVFSIMNKSLFVKYEKIYWSENTWVIAPGAPGTVDWLHELPDHILKLIRKVELKFSTVDIRKDAEDVSLRKFPPLSEKYKVPSYLKPLYHRLLLDYVWSCKFEAISRLELDELTLDFTEAYSIGGHFIGQKFVRTALPALPFARQFPKKLDVWAPDTDTGDKIHERIRRQNKALISPMIDAPEDPGWPEAGGDDSVWSQPHAVGNWLDDISA